MNCGVCRIEVWWGRAGNIMTTGRASSSTTGTHKRRSEERQPAAALISSRSSSTGDGPWNVRGFNRLMLLCAAVRIYIPLNHVEVKLIKPKFEYNWMKVRSEKMNVVAALNISCSVLQSTIARKPQTLYSAHLWSARSRRICYFPPWIDGTLPTSSSVIKWTFFNWSLVSKKHMSHLIPCCQSAYICSRGSRDRLSVSSRRIYKFCVKRGDGSSRDSSCLHVAFR